MLQRQAMMTSTIEKNCKDIKFKNYQFLVDVKVTTIEHNDTVSLKYGGTHMKSVLV